MKPPVFARERVSVELFQEMLPLMLAHWKEIAHFADIPLNPDFQIYSTLDSADQLRVYTVRMDGILVGYAVFFLRTNPHYMTSKQATQDVLYIDPGIRGADSIQFLRFCNSQLQMDGAQAVYHHVKTAHNFGPVLKRLGFTHVEEIYTMRLDKED